MAKILWWTALIALLLFLTACSVKQNVSLEEMKSCNTKEDCVVVDCGCSCSGCGGFSYDDAVNKEYEKSWYLANNCEKTADKKCPEVCCLAAELVCENNQCMVKRISEISQ